MCRQYFIELPLEAFVLCFWGHLCLDQSMLQSLVVAAALLQNPFGGCTGDRRCSKSEHAKAVLLAGTPGSA